MLNNPNPQEKENLKYLSYVPVPNRLNFPIFFATPVAS